MATGYLENELTLPQGDSDLDSKFLLGLSVMDSGCGAFRLARSSKEKLHIGVWMKIKFFFFHPAQWINPSAGTLSGNENQRTR